MQMMYRMTKHIGRIILSLVFIHFILRKCHIIHEFTQLYLIHITCVLIDMDKQGVYFTLNRYLLKFRFTIFCVTNDLFVKHSYICS